MSLLFWVARHGTTDDTQKNIYRGDRNSKLDQAGFRDAHELKEFFQNKNWSSIVYSGMDRARQTASVISDGDENKMHGPFSVLDPWDIGYLAGKDKTEYQKDMQVFIDFSDMRPLHGETLDEFRERLVPIFMMLIELGIRGIHVILIGHSSVIHVLSDFIYGINKKDLDVAPGGVIEVFSDKRGNIDAKVVFKPGKDDSSFGKSVS